MELTENMLASIIAEAKRAAYDASAKYFKDVLGGVDQFACGFAWVDIYTYNGARITGATKVGRMLKKCGVRQSYTKTFQIWNPAGFGAQNVDTLLAGASAAAEVFKKYGFGSAAGSRLD